MKDFETEVKNLPKFNFESFQKKTQIFDDRQVPIRKKN